MSDATVDKGKTTRRSLPREFVSIHCGFQVRDQTGIRPVVSGFISRVRLGYPQLFVLQRKSADHL